MTHRNSFSLTGLEDKTPHEIMSVVSAHMWQAGVSEDKITEYSNEVLKCRDGSAAIAYTRGFLSA